MSDGCSLLPALSRRHIPDNIIDDYISDDNIGDDCIRVVLTCRLCLEDWVPHIPDKRQQPDVVGGGEITGYLNEGEGVLSKDNVTIRCGHH